MSSESVLKLLFRNFVREGNNINAVMNEKKTSGRGQIPCAIFVFQFWFIKNAKENSIQFILHCHEVYNLRILAAIQVFSGLSSSKTNSKISEDL